MFACLLICLLACLLVGFASLCAGSPLYLVGPGAESTVYVLSVARKSVITTMSGFIACFVICFVYKFSHSLIRWFVGWLVR